MTIDLSPPSEALWSSWLESQHEWGGPSAQQPGSGLWLAHNMGVDPATPDGFATWVDALRQQPAAPTSPNTVPSTFWWAVREKRYIGSIQLRHELNDFLHEVGGHIGYSVRPSERGNGIATAALHRVLHHAAADIGLTRVLITCDENNTASRRVIEKCRGRLADTHAARLTIPRGRAPRRDTALLGDNRSNLSPLTHRATRSANTLVFERHRR